MAVVKIERSKSLKAYVNIGTNASPKTKTLTFNYIDPNAADEYVLNCGNQIIECQTHSRIAVGAVEKWTYQQE